jgi:sialate O-acetylesterase
MKTISGLIAALLFSVLASGEPRDLALQLGAPFHDNAILQQQMKVPVWGWSAPGTAVTVSFAGQKKSATADRDGKWMLELDELAASFEPATMRISEAGGKAETLSNILVGEVWLASGQSNMQWKVSKSSCRALKVEPIGDVQPIREFQVTSVVSQLHPIEKATGAWTNGEIDDHSAIAFAFAHRLYEELQVPIGILNCSFSQTSIQAWVPRAGFATGTDDYTKAIHQTCLMTDPTTPAHRQAWSAFYASLEEQLAANEARIQKGEDALKINAEVPGNLKGNRDASWLFNGRLNPVVPYAIRGGIWNQGYANMGEGLPYYYNLHSLVRGWRAVWKRPELPVYFHQFYCPGQKGDRDNSPTISSVAEMRLGTWMARDIPNAGMASQIDVAGGVHYSHKAVPGQRLARHALQKQYGKAIVADGPMFASYLVEGDKVVITFEHAEGGLVVAETGYHAVGRHEDSSGFADPKVIPNGDAQVKLFYLADADRVWHPASCEIRGSTVVVQAKGVKSPRGVSYATGGVGFQPNLYNKALLPTSPFIYYDKEMVLSKDWPDEKLKVADVTVDPGSVGKLSEYRKMPLLSTQFRDGAVLQADKPVTVWGSVRNYGEWQPEPEAGDCVVHFEFGDLHKTIPVTPEMTEWQVTLPARAATTTPSTLRVSFTIDGELAHAREVRNIVFGDVYYVAANSQLPAPAFTPSGQIVRMMRNHSKRSENKSPSRFSVCVSRTPNSESEPNANRFAARWQDAEGVAGAIGHRIAARSGRPVGIIYMQRKSPGQLRHWIAPAFLNQAPSLLEDYKTVGARYPGNPYYSLNIQAFTRQYIAEWKTYWGSYIPQMQASKAVPDASAWGSYPKLQTAAGDSTATHTYNVMVHSFTPMALKGVIMLTSGEMVTEDAGANFGPEMTALANGWKHLFGDKNVDFIYTQPSPALAPKISALNPIEGGSKAIEITDWADLASLINALGE